MTFTGVVAQSVTTVRPSAPALYTPSGHVQNVVAGVYTVTKLAKLGWVRLYGSAYTTFSGGYSSSQLGKPSALVVVLKFSSVLPGIYSALYTFRKVVSMKTIAQDLCATRELPRIMGHGASTPQFNPTQKFAGGYEYSKTALSFSFWS